MKDYGTVYEATLTRRLLARAARASWSRPTTASWSSSGWSTSAAPSAFVLVCLAAVSGYIRADEATKGYYTNRLRMLAAAGVGAAGVVIYQMVA